MRFKLLNPREVRPYVAIFILFFDCFLDCLAVPPPNKSRGNPPFEPLTHNPRCHSSNFRIARTLIVNKKVQLCL